MGEAGNRLTPGSFGARQSRESGVISYYCIVNMPGVPAREIQFLNARDDAGAESALASVAEQWVGFDTICLYHGERFIEVVSNPEQGFPQTALPPPAPPISLDMAA